MLSLVLTDRKICPTEYKQRGHSLWRPRMDAPSVTTLFWQLAPTNILCAGYPIQKLFHQNTLSDYGG
jgi:hypothetical protein